MAEQEADMLKQIKILLYGKQTVARTVDPLVVGSDSEVDHV